MQLTAMQKSVDDWIAQNGGYWDEMSMLARLVEEVGEVAREFNHRFGAKKRKEGEQGASVEEELGDLLFILICIANQQKIDLDASLTETLRKYKVRDKSRWA